MLSKQIRRNTFYTFVFNLSDSESVMAASMHLQLDPRCQRLLGSLSPGTCVFRQTQATWTNAMLCEIDYVEPARDIGSFEYEPHPYTRAISLAKSPQVLAHLDAALKEHKRTMERQSTGRESRIGQLAMRLLRLAASNLCVPVARLFDRLDRPKPKTQIAVRQYLEDKDYAKFDEPRIGRSSRLLKESTPEGYRAMKLPVPNENKGRGGIAHRHFANWIKLYLEKKGHQAHLEWKVPDTNHPVDVAVLLNSEWNVFEICVTSLDIEPHVKACFVNSNVVRSMTIITGTGIKLKELKKAIRSDPTMMQYGAKIRFEVIESYVPKELKDEGN